MSIADLEAVLSETKAKYKADKSDKKAKKVFKAAKAALAEAKEAAANKKRPAEETNQQPPKKKIKTNPSVDDLQNAADAAKQAYKANKTDKSLKTVWKNAKKALSDAKKSAVEVIDLDALKAAVKAAKKVYKDDKSNTENKAAFKAAKAALAEAEAKESAQGSESKKEDGTMDLLASLKKKPEPVAPVADVSGLSGLKRGGQTPGLSSARPDDSQNAPSKRLFLGNLSYDVDDDKAREFFKDCGELTDIFWMTDRETGDFRGIGIVEFTTQENADKAVLKNGENFMGRDLRCNYARPKPGGGGGGKGGNRRGKGPGEKPEGCDTIFMGGVSDDVTDEKVYELFKECGEINRIHWLTDKETGDFKGCGFVQFGNPDVALPIAVKLHGANFCGRTLNIDYSKPRPPKEY